MEMHTLVLSTGSNLGNRIDNLKTAAARIGQIIGPIQQISAVYESPAWGYKSKHSFFNQCMEVSSPMKPLECLERILDIEREMGRDRKISGYADRFIDVDILLYDNLILETSALRIPHERMLERKFVLLPLAEILPGLLHPVALKTIQDLLDICPDKTEVRRAI